MGLYFTRWPDRASLLLEADSPGAALELAKKAADGVAPRSVAVFPRGVFVAEVFDDEDEDGEAFLKVEPLAHVADLLAVLEDAPEDVAPSPPAAAVSIRCSSEATDDNNAVVRCERNVHTDGQHEGKGLVWE